MEYDSGRRRLTFLCIVYHNIENNNNIFQQFRQDVVVDIAGLLIFLKRKYSLCMCQILPVLPNLQQSIALSITFKTQ